MYIFGIRRAGWTRLFEKDRSGELFQAKCQPVSQKNYQKNEHALFFLWQNPLISFFLSSTYEKSWLRRFWFNFSSASAKRCVTHHDTALLTTELYMLWKRFTNWKILTNLTEDDCHSVCRNAIHYLSNSPIMRTTLTRTLINNHYDMTPGFKTITNLKGISKKKLRNWRSK